MQRRCANMWHNGARCDTRHNGARRDTRHNNTMVKKEDNDLNPNTTVRYWQESKGSWLTTTTTMNDDWSTKTVVIGFKKQVAKNESVVNGTSPSFPSYIAGTDLAFSRKYSTVMPLFITPHITHLHILKGRQSGFCCCIQETCRRRKQNSSRYVQPPSTPRVVTYLIYSWRLIISASPN
jgi:hypothetical protein